MFSFFPELYKLLRQWPSQLFLFERVFFLLPFPILIKGTVKKQGDPGAGSEASFPLCPQRVRMWFVPLCGPLLLTSSNTVFIHWIVRSQCEALACGCSRNKCGRSPGEGNGNPLQCSCLKDFLDRGAWWAIAHGVTESDTTRDWHFH